LGDTFFFQSLNLLGAGFIAIVNCLYLPFIIIVSLLVLGEELSLLQAVGSALVVFAVLIVSLTAGERRISKQNMVMGIVYGALAMIANAIGLVMIKPLLNRSPLLWVTEIRLFGGILSLCIFLLFNPARMKIIASVLTRRGWIYTTLGAFIGTYLAMLLWLWGMKLTMVSVASALNQTSNIFIFVFAVLFLREKVTTRKLVGILMAFVGVALVSFF